MDKDFDAIKYVAFRIVGVERLLARNLGVSVVVLHIIVVHYDGTVSYTHLARIKMRIVCFHLRKQSYNSR